MQFKNSENSFLNKTKHLLQQVSIKTYLYGILVMVVLIFILTQTKSNNKNYLSDNKNNTCRDIYGNMVTIDPKNGESCIMIDQIAKDYGIDLSGTKYDTNSDYVNNPNNNLTYDLSQDLIMTNLYLQQNGVTDEVTRGKVLADVLLKYKAQAEGNIQTLSALNVTREENFNSYQEYYNQVSSAFQKYGEKISESINKYKSIDNSKLVLNSDGTMPNVVSDQINKKINANLELINSLISIPATVGGASYQLEIINLLEEQNAYMQSLIKIQTDPMKFLALGGDNYLNNFETSFTKAINDFLNYFKSLGVDAK
jgi:hypothetical protein